MKKHTVSEYVGRKVNVVSLTTETGPVRIGAPSARRIAATINKLNAALAGDGLIIYEDSQGVNHIRPKPKLPTIV